MRQGQRSGSSGDPLAAHTIAQCFREVDTADGLGAIEIGKAEAFAKEMARTLRAAWTAV